MIYNKDDYLNRFDLARARIHDIATDTGNRDSIIPEYYNFFKRAAALLDYLVRLYDTDFDAVSLESLKKINAKLYYELLPEHYEESFANPDYCCRVMPDKETAQTLCGLYAEIRSSIPYVFEKNILGLTALMEVFIEIYCDMEHDLLVKDNTDEISFKDEYTYISGNQNGNSGGSGSKESGRLFFIKDALYYYVSDYSDVLLADRIRSQMTPNEHYSEDTSHMDDVINVLSDESEFIKKIVCDSDLTDLSFLYMYGDHIGPNEVKTAEYLNSLSASQICSMAETFVNGFRKGYELYNIDLKKKKTVNIRYNIGFERLVREEIKLFNAMGLEVTIYRAYTNLINKNRGISIGYKSTSPNPQYDYDHREDDALFLDKAYLYRRLDVIKNTYDKYENEAHAFAGPAVMEIFGEKPFSPVMKDTAVSYTREQRYEITHYRSLLSELTEKYIKSSEVSFTIIAYPVPEIGNDYQNIFRDTIALNTLPDDKYRDIQQALIDELDKGTAAHVTGRNGNKTDIWVSLNTPEDPEHETAFENCLADVNIPLGEVFTSPVLKGTTGLLNVSDIYLNGLQFLDLNIWLKDGLVTDYSCSNFADAPEDNGHNNAKVGRDYISRNILFNHDTLPLGEFAIGTNTTAYVMARKYGIESMMPILIEEKTGPHFALGDTCYSHEEDLVTYNPDGKKMTAKENDFSKKRSTDPAKAYFNCHTDITIPYSELGSIIVKHADGSETSIIEDGLFVLPGTEALNDPLKESD
ncbi:MAG: aminopeptidase [Lachnospiraceae bacterium]|jgi:aminopeptidase|nr:aminopeptidase [Lachnospiraceae bacterium]MEE3460344.1 aminopeptidase [Lachnospiraceae bacterium]